MVNSYAIALLKSEQNGVEFYTVQSTGESGMSQSGLAILAGVGQSTLFDLQKTLFGKAPSECLEPFVGKDLTLFGTDFTINGKQVGNLKIYISSYCAAVLQHYATKGNQTALFSLLKFAQQGIEKWIHEITGYNKPAQPTLPQDYLSALKALVAVEEEKLVLVAENKEQKKALKAAAPKLEEHENLISKSSTTYTVTEAAKIINCPGMGPRNLKAFVRSLNVYTQYGSVYQKFIDKGYFKVTLYSRGGTEYDNCKLTATGIAWLREELLKAHYKVPQDIAA